MKSVIIIPARMESRRFPGKPLADCGGVPLLQRTVDAARKTSADFVLVASPDREICEYCESAGITWKPTRNDHPSGTHRCAEIVERMNEKVDTIVNWQVDEPLVNPDEVDRMLEGQQAAAGYITTLVASIDAFDAHDEDVVKAIVLAGGGLPYCQWFSRAPMAGACGHIGIYAFNRATLLQLGKIDSTELSRQESLEQLTWLEYGKTILAMAGRSMPQAVNVPADLEKVRKLI